MKVKVVLMLSFLIVGLIFITNEPPIYSKENTKEYIEESYDISSVREDIFKEARTIKATQKNLKLAVKRLEKDNANLKNKLELLSKSDTSKTIIDSTKAEPIIEPKKKKGFIKRVLKID